jgi:hypothetical protein
MDELEIKEVSEITKINKNNSGYFFMKNENDEKIPLLVIYVHTDIIFEKKVNPLPLTYPFGLPLQNYFVALFDGKVDRVGVIDEKSFDKMTSNLEKDYSKLKNTYNFENRVLFAKKQIKDYS